MKNRLTPTQVPQLRANVFVENVTENYVFFTEAFKQLAYDQRQKGKPLREIFRDNGIDPDVIGSLRIYGGTGSTGIEAPAEVKYGLIHEAVSHDDNLLNISYLCRLAGVSRSGYYAWIEAAPTRQAREDHDKLDFDKVLEAFKYRYPKGGRGIYMRLLHTGERMNLKKIRRLMRKYGLKCPFRKPNPYKQLARPLHTSTVAPNVVNRDFISRGPRKVLLTDITYLFYKGGCCYLSTILDAVSHEVLAWQLSESLEVQLFFTFSNTASRKSYLTFPPEWSSIWEAQMLIKY